MAKEIKTDDGLIAKAQQKAGRHIHKVSGMLQQYVNFAYLGNQAEFDRVEKELWMFVRTGNFPK